MNILGINYYFHDSSACLVKDDKLVVAVEEERFTREKHTSAFPAQAVTKCLEVGGLQPGDVEHIALAVDPRVHWGMKTAYALANPKGAQGFMRAELRRLWSRDRALKAWLASLWPDPARRPRLHYVEHHLSHVAGSFLVSPYDQAALLGLDGSGEWATSFLGVGRGATVERFHQSFFPHSLGSFYEAATEYCGFRPNYDEGKTMGLAPYGDAEVFHRQVGELVRVDDEGGIHVDLSCFRYQFHGKVRCAPKFISTFGPARPYSKTAPFQPHHHNVAAAFQRVLEERVLAMCRTLRERTRCRHLVVAGGVALNSVMNGRIVRESGFDDIYVMPGAGDNGTCIGAAFYVNHVVLGRPRGFCHDDPYIGNGYSDEELRQTIESCNLPLERHDDIERVAAELLAEGRMLGWFQGKMEFGPRALGNRSILANPCLPDMKEVLNARVKHREPFRPFAPSVTKEAAGDFFETRVEAPFMLKVMMVRPDLRQKLPAITHVDGSARMQTVRAEINPRYHKLLTELGQRTGAPVVLNTSFNIMGEPIVESPLQAIRCFYSTGLDELILGNYVLRKKPVVG
jgi:carbamoyltransferase